MKKRWIYIGLVVIIVALLGAALFQMEAEPLETSTLEYKIDCRNKDDKIPLEITSGIYLWYAQEFTAKKGMIFAAHIQAKTKIVRTILKAGISKTLTTNTDDWLTASVPGMLNGDMGIIGPFKVGDSPIQLSTGSKYYLIFAVMGMPPYPGEEPWDSLYRNSGICNGRTFIYNGATEVWDSKDYSLSYALSYINEEVLTLTVHTSPDACTIKIGEETKTSSGGKATFNLVSGSYSIEVSKSGYYKQERTVSLESSKSESFTLQKVGSETYDLIVSTTPLDCDVQVVGMETQNTKEGPVTFHDLVPAAYEIVVSKSGYVTKTKSVVIASDRTETFSLEKEGPDLFEVSIGVLNKDTAGVVEGVQVFLGTEGGKTNEFGIVTFNVEQGTYEVSIEKEGFTSLTDELDITEDWVEWYEIEKEGFFAPGFELLAFLVAMGIAFVLIKRGKK